jgi:glycosyltransferase involved in cell wall biosynthesis
VRRIIRAKSAVVPNGINVPELNSGDKTITKGPSLLYLGRLHPIKGIENLLRALTTTDLNVRLSICGDGEKEYRESLEVLCDELQIAERVTFHGMVEASERERHFQNAGLCVVPSHKEAFCLVVAESLARGVPVIVSSDTPWKNVVTVGCGLCVDNDSESLSEAIASALKMPLAEMGQRGREWMQRDYSWALVAGKIAARYIDLMSHTFGKQVRKWSSRDVNVPNVREIESGDSFSVNLFK